MQAGKTKQDRRATSAARAAARPLLRVERRVARIKASMPPRPDPARVNEARKHAAASPTAIAVVRAAYRAQCIQHEADKAQARTERKQTTIPAEAASNETR